MKVLVNGLALIAVLLVVVGCGRSTKPHSGKYVEKYPTGQKKIECSYTNGLLHGLFVEWHENGVKKLEVPYNFGNMEGLYREWDTNDVLIIEAQMSNGFNHGEARYFFFGQERLAHYNMGKDDNSPDQKLVFRNSKPWEGVDKVYPWQERGLTGEEREIVRNGGSISWDFSRYEIRTYAEGVMINTEKIDERR